MPQPSVTTQPICKPYYEIDWELPFAKLDRNAAKPNLHITLACIRPIREMRYLFRNPRGIPYLCLSAFW